MKKSTFSVNFFIRHTRLGKSGETPIIMRISVGGRYTELSTQRRVLVEQWSQSRCCATGKTAVALEINRHLDNLRSKASEAHQNFLAEDGSDIQTCVPHWRKTMSLHSPTATLRTSQWSTVDDNRFTHCFKTRTLDLGFSFLF